MKYLIILLCVSNCYAWYPSYSVKDRATDVNFKSLSVSVLDLNSNQTVTGTKIFSNIGIVGNISSTGTINNVGNAYFSGNVGIGTTNPTSKLEVNGFTELGESSPKIKIKKVTGTTSSDSGGTVAITHGLTYSKIISAKAMVDTGAEWIMENQGAYPQGNRQFVLRVNGTTADIYNVDGNYSAIASKSVVIFLFYEE